MSDTEETQDTTVEDSPETPLLQEETQQEEEPQEEVPPEEEPQTSSSQAEEPPVEVANDVIASHVEDGHGADAEDTKTGVGAVSIIFDLF